MSEYRIDGSSRGGVWKRRLLLAFGGFFAVVWLLILPLPGPMARARHRWLAEAAESPAGEHTTERRASRFNDGAQGVVSFSGSSDSSGSNGSKGSWRMQVDSCASGQHREFYGVSLVETAQPKLALNVVLPEDGTGHITVKTPGGMLDVIPKEQCSVWDVVVEEDGTVANDIYELAGHARFDCTLPDRSAHVTGDVTLKSCH
jgi:hypothetical protein